MNVRHRMAAAGCPACSGLGCSWAGCRASTCAVDICCCWPSWAVHYKSAKVLRVRAVHASHVSRRTVVASQHVRPGHAAPRRRRLWQVQPRRGTAMPRLADRGGHCGGGLPMPCRGHRRPPEECCACCGAPAHSLRGITTLEVAPMKGSRGCELHDGSRSLRCYHCKYVALRRG